MNNLLKIFCMFGFFLTLPIILLSLICIWIEDGLPLVFVQKRLGENKKEFNLYKIRTMYKSTPNLGTHEVNKIHHLKFGIFIRKLKIDELPQIINYIIGDINLIGPRPGLINQEKLKQQREKFNIYNSKPGITGLAQVLGYDMSNPELLAMIDDLYIRQKTTKLDITIFLATFFSIFRKKLNQKYGDNIQEFKDQLNYV